MRHKESEMQIRCVTRFRREYPEYACLLFHPRNEGSGHSVEDRKRQTTAKKEGVQAGVADLMLALPSRMYHALAIEMKTKTGRQTKEQKLWQRYFEAAGGRYVIVRSDEEFDNEIAAYMGDLFLITQVRVNELHEDIEAEKTAEARKVMNRILGKE